jgi:hypothetical protein
MTAKDIERERQEMQAQWRAEAAAKKVGACSNCLLCACRKVSSVLRDIVSIGTAALSIVLAPVTFMFNFACC